MWCIICSWSIKGPLGGLFSAMPSSDFPAVVTKWVLYLMKAAAALMLVSALNVLHTTTPCPHLNQPNERRGRRLTSPLHFARPNEFWWFSWHQKGRECARHANVFFSCRERKDYFPGPCIQHALCPTSHDASEWSGITKRTLCRTQTHRLSSPTSLFSILSLLLSEQVTPTD